MAGQILFFRDDTVFTKDLFQKNNNILNYLFNQKDSTYITNEGDTVKISFSSERKIINTINQKKHKIYLSIENYPHKIDVNEFLQNLHETTWEIIVKGKKEFTVTFFESYVNTLDYKEKVCSCIVYSGDEKYGIRQLFSLNKFGDNLFLFVDINPVELKVFQLKEVSNELIKALYYFEDKVLDVELVRVK